MAADRFNITLLILAAGHGRRMGLTSSKALVKIGDRTLLQYALRQEQELPHLKNTIVVTNSHAAEEVGLEIAQLPKQQGLTRSVLVADTRSAFASLRQGLFKPECSDFVLIGLVDSLVPIYTGRKLQDACSYETKAVIAVVESSERDRVEVEVSTSGRATSVFTSNKQAPTLTSGGWLYMSGDAERCASRAWNSGIRTLREFQGWLVRHYRVQAVTVQYAVDLDCATDLERAEQTIFTNMI